MNPFWLNLSQKKSFLVRSDILRLLLNTLIFNDKYSHSNMDNLWQQIHIELSQKLKTFCQTLIAFLESTLNLQHFEKKSLIAQAFLKFLNLTDLLTYIHKRSSFWKASPVNMFTSPKNCWNLQKSTFILLFHHSGANWVGKSHF